MPWTQHPTNSASVHHPEENQHTNNLVGVMTLAGANGLMTGAEGINDGSVTMPLFLLGNQITAYPTVDGMRTVPGPNFIGVTGFTSGDPPPVITKDESYMEREATAGVYDGSPQHIASGDRPYHELPTATRRRRGPLLPVDPEDNLTRLKARLVEGGATVEVVELCDEVFQDGVNRGKLETRLTHSQCKELGLRDGKRYQVFLEKVEVMGGATNRCRLCPLNDAMTYKNHRSGLRHLLKDHFGLSFECMHW